MCKRYGFDPITLCPQLERVFEHMSKQGWDPKKWKENEGPIRCAIFYWVCNVQNVGLRDGKFSAMLIPFSVNSASYVT